jgi:Protein of unknown function (DUF1553)/Protein of unknown function (DUF1549)/Bacterial Ig-like domain (group 2)
MTSPLKNSFHLMGTPDTCAPPSTLTWSIPLNRSTSPRMPRVALCMASVVALLSVCGKVNAQTTIASIKPASCQPGVPCKLTLNGSKLPVDLRVRTNRSDVKVEIESVADTQAILVITASAESRLGPCGLWFANASGPLATKLILVDDLPSALDNGNNHSIATAQSVAPFIAIDGVSEGSQFDYYRFSATAGQRIAFDVLTQAIHSKMDPIVRLIRADGQVLHVEDDDATGPDCRFSHTFVEAGDYLLQVGESHYAVGGEYHLRIGDFPIFHHAFPLAVRRGENAKVSFVGPDTSAELVTELSVPPTTMDSSLSVSARKPDGKSAAWGTIAIFNAPQHVEPAKAVAATVPAAPEPTVRQALELPIGISGRLEYPGERDNYWLRGAKGQVIRFVSRTRSLGCATMLQMQLWNTAGAKLAETPVNESDEWSFDVTLPDDGEYRLEVGDLLKRGGNAFGYLVEATPAGNFSIAVKPDPKGRQSFAVEELHGGFAVDLLISRFGYEGEIDLSIDAGQGLRLLNPRVVAGAKEHHAILLAIDGWQPQSFSLLRLHAAAVGNPAMACEVSSRSLSKLLEPHVVSPASWNDGVLSAAGVGKTDSLFKFESPTKLLLDRAAQSHSIVVNVNRIKKDFKAGVSVDGSLLIPGWGLTSKVDKDTVTLTITRPTPDSNPIAREPENLTLLGYTELSDHVHWETIRLPVKWVDRPVRFEAYPATIDLEGASASQQIVVTGFDAAGQANDWTHDVSLLSANPAIATIQNNTVVPVANGATEILVQIGETRHAIPVKVASIEQKRPVAFESEVLVALSKQGCNSGACHGSPSGKGNFRLSLRAFDRVLDELTLIREDFGRRVNPIEPEQSLLLLKPIMKLAHGGGQQLSKDDIAYKLLRDWIAEGAKADPAGTPRCTKLEVYPNQKRVLKRTDGTQQLSATAIFANGQKRDATRLVAYESTNNEVATVDKQGLVTPHGRGETVILVRYLEHIESVPLMFVDDVPGFQWSEPATSNYIDVLVNAKLKQLQYLPAPTCTDAVFLRRVYMDVIGVLPSIEETNAFLADNAVDKRAKLIDKLLERDEYPKFWALKWGDLLRMTSKLVGPDGVYKYHRWLESAIRSNMHYDEFARELLSASGSTLSNPAANFYRTSSDMNECVETVSQVFLGARLQCAKCHNHPFERWTQDNYYGLGAFFNRLQRKTSQRPGELFVWTAASGEVTQPRTGEVMKPWLPQVGSIEPKPEEDRRPAFVNWLIDAKNPYFAKIEANRIWSQMFARGIVDPIDDFRDSNPPSNEPLLEALAKDFVDSGFDRKHLIRSILNSKTYQASSEASEWNEKDKIYFSHQAPRMLGAEQLLDAINHVTGLTQTFAGLPADMKATQLPAPDVAKNAFLKVFGQPERSTVCACERAEDSNLGMAIELFNGPLVYEKLRDANNRFRKSYNAGRTPPEVIRELYLAALCRQPSDTELEASLQHCQSRGGDLVAGFEDLCWVLLNTDEFLFQH